MSATQKPPTSIYQHMCLHNALPVKVQRDGEAVQFLDVNYIDTNNYKNVTHSDRLLDHYLSTPHQKELAEATENNVKQTTCICNDYSNYLRKEYLHGQRAANGSMRERLMRQLQQ